jgi:hypothetical protein
MVELRLVGSVQLFGSVTWVSEVDCVALDGLSVEAAFTVAPASDCAFGALSCGCGSLTGGTDP